VQPDHPRLGIAATREELLKEKFTAYISDEQGAKTFQTTLNIYYPKEYRLSQ
jgi:hypothetical protein